MQQPRCALGPLHTMLELTAEPQPLSNIDLRKAVETMATHFPTKSSQFFISCFFPACLNKCACSYRDVTFTLWMNPKVLLKHHRWRSLPNEDQTSVETV